MESRIAMPVEEPQRSVEVTPKTAAATDRPKGIRRYGVWLLLFGLWLLLFGAALFSPPLLDDADATHANAARHIALTGDWVTLQVNGIRYLEKAPLPYWLVAISFRLFGFNTFAAHLPQALAVLFLALLGYRWTSSAFSARVGFYTALATLTAAGVFLFTRIFIPEVWLSLFLCASLYFFLEALDKLSARSAYAMWATLALAVLTKGLVALVFFFGAAGLYLIASGDLWRWRALRPLTGMLLFLVIAAPWHILAGLRNTGGANGHGFFWFYFVNEHVLRFLGRRQPMDYNKLPGYLFWSLHLVWLFPWSLLLPALVAQAVRAFRAHRRASTPLLDHWPLYTIYIIAITGVLLRNLARIPYLMTVVALCTGILVIELFRRQQAAAPGTALLRVETYAERTTLLLTLFSGLVLGFFSLSTNQEYYTFPAYLPLTMLLMQAHAYAEQNGAADLLLRRLMNATHLVFAMLGLGIAAALGYGLWTSRHLAFVPDIGDLLAHRGVGDYTLSMSHLFDLTGPSFAALRLPAGLAAAAFAFGPILAWVLRGQRRHLGATLTIAATSAVFLIAAHIALVSFGPMLSSQDLAEKIQELEDDRAISRDSQVLLYGDQAFGSSIPFYLGEDVALVEGRSTSMLFGSSFPDAPHIFLSAADLLAQWGKGERKLLFVPIEKRDEVDRLLGARQIRLEETSGKALVTDRPLDRTPPNDPVHAPSVFPRLHRSR